MKNASTKYPSRKGPNGPSNRNQQKYIPQYEVKQNETSRRLETNQVPKSPLQCWGCGEPHYYKNFPHRARLEIVTNIQEASTVGDMERNIPRIKATLEDHQA